MIGNGLKKLAQARGMKVGSGVAYGSLGGFAATMSEGSGWKKIEFVTRFTDPAKQQAFLNDINGTDLSKAYHVNGIQFTSRGFMVVFLDTVGTVKKIEACLDWLLPRMEFYGATHADVCAECGGIILQDVQWELVDDVVLPLHAACAERLRGKIEAEDQARREADTGNYLTGAVGALLGAAVGAVAWAVVLMMGYVASLVGLLMGWLASFGYDKFKGRQGRLKVVILIVAVIAGVVLGTYGGAFLQVTDALKEAGLTDLSFEEQWEFFQLVLEDGDAQEEMTGNLVQGLLFAALGVGAMLWQTAKSTGKKKSKALK